MSADIAVPPENDMQSLRILKHADKALSKATKSLIILDSSFNPPHNAHLAMIRTALQKEHEKPASVLLMYATKNADKGSKGEEENDTRVELMQAFSTRVSELCETHICLTQHPYFVDKFKAVKRAVPDATQIYIVGYDTFVRILDKKYYPDQDLSKSGLDDFFQHGKLLCAMRQDDKHGDTSSQVTYIEDLKAGKIANVPSQWGQNIDILTLKDDEGRGVSSTVIRKAVVEEDEATLAKLLTPEVRHVISQKKLYRASAADSTPEQQQNENDFPYLSRTNVLNCSFSHWHTKFKHISPRARIIKPLPLSFIQYLNEDGLMLPQDSKTISKIVQVDDSDDSEESDFEDEGFSEEDPTDAFKDLHARIEDEIRALGGAVVPKLNWSCPKDAVWITADKTLKCTSPNDIYLLLKSSDFIVHDLEHAFDACNDGGDIAAAAASMGTSEYELVLKKWFNAQPSMEFRCFVKDSHLVAVSQRDVNYYDFLQEQASTLVTLASRLFTNDLQSNFPDANFVFDMYASVQQDKAWLMDINPYCANTDALLFSWPEILAKSVEGDPEIRLVSKDTVMSHGPQYSAHQVPLELIETSDGVDPATFAEEFQRKLAKAAFDS